MFSQAVNEANETCWQIHAACALTLASSASQCVGAPDCAAELARHLRDHQQRLRRPLGHRCHTTECLRQCRRPLQTKETKECITPWPQLARKRRAYSSLLEQARRHNRTQMRHPKPTHPPHPHLCQQHQLVMLLVLPTPRHRHRHLLRQPRTCQGRAEEHRQYLLGFNEQ